MRENPSNSAFCYSCTKENASADLMLKAKPILKWVKQQNKDDVSNV